MIKSEWFKIIAVLQARWPQRPIPTESAEVWFSDLEEYQAEDVAAAAEALYRDGREFAPNGAQIRNKLLELRSEPMDHSQAYALAMEAARKGVDAGLDWLREQSPIAAQAAEAYGWWGFCKNGTIDEGTRRAHFRDVFKNLAAREERDQRYMGIEAPGLKGLPSGPKRIGDVISMMELDSGEEAA